MPKTRVDAIDLFNRHRNLDLTAVFREYFSLSKICIRFVLYWIFPYTGLDFVALVKQKPYSVVQERGRWITKTAFLTEPTPMVSITRCRSSHKLKNLCSKGKPHWFFARISLTVVGLAASSFGFRVRGVLTKGISVKISFFVQYYSQFRSNWWNSECSVEEGMLLRKSRHKCCFCLEESFICVENKPCKTKTNKKWNELLMLKWNTPPFTHNIIILLGNVFLNNITNLLCIHMSVYVWQHKLHWMEILLVKRNLLKSHPVILEVIQSS